MVKLQLFKNLVVMWKHTLSLLIILIVRISLCNAKQLKELQAKQSRSIGGKEAKPGQFPSAVSLRGTIQGQNHHCSGTIIDKKWVLTTTECIINYMNDPNYNRKKDGVYELFAIVAGEIHQLPLEKARQVRRVTDIFPHQKWVFKSFNYDIALLKVQVPFEFKDKFVKPMILNHNKEIKHGDECTIAGWGVRGAKNSRTGPKLLLYMTRPYLNKKECIKLMENSKKPGEVASKVGHESILCAGDKSGKNKNCDGDEGSGLICDNRLVGVLSFEDCASHGVSIFQNVKFHYRWINEIMSNFTKDELLSDCAYSQKPSEFLLLLSILVFIFFHS